jgi:hypothetical protein
MVTFLGTSDYLPEPLLLFTEDGLHVDAKAGIAVTPRRPPTERHGR